MESSMEYNFFNVQEGNAQPQPNNEGDFFGLYQANSTPAEAPAAAPAPLSQAPMSYDADFFGGQQISREDKLVADWNTERIQQSVQGIQQAQHTINELAEIIDSAVYLDDTSFEHAAVIEEKDIIIADLRSKIKDLAHELERRNVALIAARTERSQAERQVNTLEARVKELEEQIQSKDTVLQLHMDQLQAKHGEIESRDAEIATLRSKFDMLGVSYSASPS